MGVITRSGQELEGPGIHGLSPADQASIRAARPANISAAEWESFISSETGDAASIAASAGAAAEVYRSLEMEDIQHHDGESEADARRTKEAGETPFTSLERLMGENLTGESSRGWTGGGLIKAIVTTAVELYNHPRETLLSGARWLLKTGEELWESTQKFIHDTISRADSTLSAAKTGLSNAVTELGDWISEKTSNVYNSFSNYFNFGSSQSQPTPSARPAPATADTPAEEQNLTLTPGLISQTAGPSLNMTTATVVSAPTPNGGYTGRQPHRIALFSDRGLEPETALPGHEDMRMRPNFALIVKAAGVDATNTHPMPG